ncbi:methyltransferase domain-containing protein [bacterium]|nr:methyltransferase domain-containing protein [candidate division CSSED10-310 bacterium]
MGKSHPDSVYELPFDQYQRYRSLWEYAELFRERFGTLHILDVGGYLQGSGQEDVIPASMFLPRDRITLVDIKFKGPGTYVVASGSKLPFPDSSFDIVAAMDTLEHIPPPDRPGFVKEVCRVAGKGVFVAVPVFDPWTVLAEKLLDQVILRIFRVRHPMLAEHLEYGLPRTEDIASWIDNSKFNWVDYADGFLPNWLFMMILKHYLLTLEDPFPVQRQLDRFYNLTLGETDRRQPAYRRVWAGVQNGLDLPVAELAKPADRSRIHVGEQYGFQMADLLLMIETTRLNERVSEFFQRNPSWMELMDLAEERHKIILQKDDLIIQNLNLLREREDFIKILESRIIEREEKISSMKPQIRKLEDDRNALQMRADNLQSNLDRIHGSLPYRIYRLLRHGRLE